MHDLKKMMGKEDKEKDSMKKDAKLKVLKHLREMASGMMGEDLKGGMEGMKKVTVAADSKEGLEKGLEKAKEVMDMGPGDMEEEMPEMEDEDMEECTPEEIDEKIAKLQAMKEKMSKS